MKYILPLLLIPMIAFGANFPRDLTLTLTQPSEYEDGSSIELGDLVSNRFLCTRQDGTEVVNESRPVTTGPGEFEEFVFVGVIPGPGTYTCNAWASTAELESLASNDATKKHTGKPLPPIVIEVT
jgi:hypothetical protein